jgi:undecaprenyl-phosphate 4-deoxy-4-formamido-L-arabinose transferase
MGSAGLFMLLLIRRFIIGAEVQGVFTLFAITFFLLGVIIFALGLLGEYIGRIYQQVRARPRYLVQTILEQRNGEAVPGTPRQSVVQAVQPAHIVDQGQNP